MGGDSGGVLEEDEYGFFWEYIDMIHNDQNGARESSKAFLQDPLGVERLILVDYEYSYATFERRLVGNKPGTGTKISYLKADAYVQVYDMREGIMTGASKAEIPTGERNTAEQVIVSDENIMTAIRKALNPVQAQ